MSYFLVLGETCVNAGDVSQIVLAPLTKTNKDDASATTEYRAVLAKSNGSEIVLMQSQDKAQVLKFINESCCKLNNAIDC